MLFSNALSLVLFFVAGQAFAGPIFSNPNADSVRRDDAFSSFASGKGSQTFANAGAACTVGNDQGTCDQFGRCAQFIPPNENSILNQGRTVAACTAGGATGTT